MIRKCIRKNKTWNMAKALTLALLMTAFLSGCGGSSPVTDEKNTVGAEESNGQNSVSDEEAGTVEAGDENMLETEKDVETETTGDIPEISLRCNHYYEHNDDYLSLYEAEYDELVLSQETKEAYPELAAALDEYNEERKQAVWSDKDSTIEAAREHSVESPDTFSAYQNMNTLFIRRADSEVLSVLQYNYSYEGGVHGYYGHGGTTFDVRNGKRVALTDVVADQTALADYVTERVKELYPDLESVVGTIEETIQEYFSGQAGYEAAWVMEPYGVTFFFSPYLLGSYADGEQQVTISFSEKPELFTGNYQENKAGWGYRFDECQPQYVDLDGDGSLDQIEVRGGCDEISYEYYKGVEILVNGKSYEGEIYGYDVQPTLVKNSEGNYYVYVESMEDNDWHGLYLFDINGEKPFKIGETSGTFTSGTLEYSYEEGSYSEMTSQLYDPEHFYIGTRMQTLSTYNGSRPYKVGVTGMVEPLLPWFTTSPSIVLTSKMDLELDVVDEENGETLEAGVRIPAGTEFTIWRTDDESFVDCQLSDGRMVRVPVEAEGWPQTINGRDIEDVFDGVIFAG